MDDARTIVGSGNRLSPKDFPFHDTSYYRRAVQMFHSSIPRTPAKARAGGGNRSVDHALVASGRFTPHHATIQARFDQRNTRTSNSHDEPLGSRRQHPTRARSVIQESREPRKVP
jgi:hypothetical protein